MSLGISLFTTAYESSVIPLFASVPTLKYLNYVVNTSTALAVITPKLSSSKILIILGSLVLLAPHTSYWVGVHAARFRDPIYSPLATHALVLAPVVYFAVSLAMSIDVSSAYPGPEFTPAIHTLLKHLTSSLLLSAAFVSHSTGCQCITASSAINLDIEFILPRRFKRCYCA